MKLTEQMQTIKENKFHIQREENDKTSIKTNLPSIHALPFYILYFFFKTTIYKINFQQGCNKERSNNNFPLKKSK